MGKYKLIALTNPREGHEDEYNEWYNNIHLKDVVSVPGLRSAQRFKLINSLDTPHSHQYIAIYEMESDDPQMVAAELLRRPGTEAMMMSEALDEESSTAGVFEVCSSVVKAADATGD